MNKHIENTVHSEIDNLCIQVIEDLKSLKSGYAQSGELSDLKNIWEEFAYQVQYEESVLWNNYVDQVENSCLLALEKYADNELFCIWAIVGNFDDWYGVIHIDFDGFIIEVKKQVKQILYDKVLDNARFCNIDIKD